MIPSLSLLVGVLAVTGVVDSRTAQFPSWFRLLRLYLSGLACLGLGCTLGFLLLVEKHMSSRFESDSFSIDDGDMGGDGAEGLLPAGIRRTLPALEEDGQDMLLADLELDEDEDEVKEEEEEDKKKKKK